VALNGAKKIELVLLTTIRTGVPVNDVPVVPLVVVAEAEPEIDTVVVDGVTVKVDPLEYKPELGV
jgi:hypothetical protein